MRELGAMLKTLIKKEITETILDLRFVIATLLCVVLIPLGMYVSLKEYEQRLQTYQTSIQQYQERSRDAIGYEFKAEGYRPPSPLSVFASGLKDILNLKVTATNSGNPQIESQTEGTNLQAALFGRIDFVYIVSTVLSLLAFIFTFSAVTSEKETGTLRQMLSNSVPRSCIILSKILGNYLVFLAPFILSLLLGLLILNASTSFTLLSQGVFPAIVIILLITLLFMFCNFCLGVLVSVLTHRSVVSMIVILLVWAVCALIVPKISPRIAQIMYPIRSQLVVDVEKRMTIASLQDELRSKRSELLRSILDEKGIDFKEGDGNFDKAIEPAKEAYNQAKVTLEREYKERIATALRQIENEYANKRRVQGGIGVNLSRVSPICCFTYALSELAGTGTSEMDNFTTQAKQFQENVEHSIYNNIEVEVYQLGGHDQWHIYDKDGFNSFDIQIPNLTDYQHTTLAQALGVCWVDIVLLVLFSVLFFAGAFVSFLRYDVR